MEVYQESVTLGIYYVEFLAVCPVKVKNLNECLLFEVSIKNKKGYVFSLYRSPSKFFLINLEQLIGDIIAKNHLFVLITGDLMLDHQIGGKIIFLPLKVLKSIHSLIPMV